MKIAKIFPTLIAEGLLPHASSLNRALLREIILLSQQDRVGQAWSKDNYVGGYTSYASLNDLQFRSPTFAKFADFLEPEVKRFARAQGWSLKAGQLRMTSLWMNLMPRHSYHNLHLHPHSVISGAYYVSTPPGSVSLKLEDPRMPLYMNAPNREKFPFTYEIEARAGKFVLFESWLRHEVPPNASVKPRISLSFNYEMEPKE